MANLSISKWQTRKERPNRSQTLRYGRKANCDVSESVKYVWFYAYHEEHEPVIEDFGFSGSEFVEPLAELASGLMVATEDSFDTNKGGVGSFLVIKAE